MSYLSQLKGYTFQKKMLTFSVVLSIWFFANFTVSMKLIVRCIWCQNIYKKKYKKKQMEKLNTPYHYLYLQYKWSNIYVTVVGYQQHYILFIWHLTDVMLIFDTMWYGFQSEKIKPITFDPVLHRIFLETWSSCSI